MVLAGIYWLYPPQKTVATPAVATTHQPVRLTNQSPSRVSVPFDFREAARTATPAVVHISSLVRSNNSPGNPLRFFFGDEEESPFTPQRGTGSGVIYTSDGYIVTNNHVVENADEVEVTLTDNRQFIATVVGTDRKSDLAVIKIEGDNLPSLELADSDLAEIGEWVLAVGNPLDLTSTVTAGIISAKGRSLRLLEGQDAIEAFIQTDAAVNPGNSGGALVDAEGRLLGINTAIATRTGLFQGYSFAIPINLVTRIVDDIIEFGSYQRAFLGVNIYPLNSEEAAVPDVPISQGVVIDNLVDGGSAQYAGLRAKDIIVKVDDRTIRDVPELTEIVGRAKVGDVLAITVFRDGEEVQIPVRMRADE